MREKKWFKVQGSGVTELKSDLNLNLNIFLLGNSGILENDESTWFGV